MCVIVMIAFTAPVFAQNPQQLFQQGVLKENGEGDLKAAITIYERIVNNANADRSIRAKAQLHIGMCYEKLGNTEAVKAYEAVLSQFPGEDDVVVEARNRLAVLREEKAAGLTVTRLLPSDIYLECQTLSPDGMKVAGIVFDMPEGEGQNLAVYDLASGNLELITHYNYSKESQWIYVPIWSPDGREVAYEVGDWGVPASELWASDLAGKSRLLFKNTHGALAPCDWLPDGSAVLIMFENENNTSSMGLVSVKDGSLRELYPMQSNFGPLSDDVIGGYADVSPDGRFIAFADGSPDAGLNISVISTEGGAPSIMIDHPADDKQPRWSPDGRHIVFLSNRHGSWALWGISIRDGKPDGSAFMILEGMQDAQLASWTKKGLLSRTLSLLRDVYTLEIDPKSHQVLGKPQALDFTSLGLPYFSLWSPDGKYLSILLFSKVGQSWERSIALMPSKEGETRKFDNIPFLNSQQGLFQWLPDGSALGFVSIDEEERLHFVRLDSKTREWMSRSIPAGEFSGLSSNIAWSGDGKTFFYGKREEAGSVRAVIAHDLETGQEHSILRAGPTQPLPAVYSLKISRDYRRLVLGARGQIVLVDTDSDHAEWLDCGEKNKLEAPSWSPDGQFLVTYGNSGPNEYANELFIVSLTDGQVKNLDISQYLPRRSQIYMPDWSPDGRKIAFNTWMNKIETNLITNVIPEE